jgi:hypothetical protein
MKDLKSELEVRVSASPLIARVINNVQLVILRVKKLEAWFGAKLFCACKRDANEALLV